MDANKLVERLRERAKFLRTLASYSAPMDASTHRDNADMHEQAADWIEQNAAAVQPDSLTIEGMIAAHRKRESAAAQGPLAKSARSTDFVNGADKPGEKGLTPVSAAPLAMPEEPRSIVLARKIISNGHPGALTKAELEWVNYIDSLRSTLKAALQRIKELENK